MRWASTRTRHMTIGRQFDDGRPYGLRFRPGLEPRKPLEWHRAGEFDPVLFQSQKDELAIECAVDSGFKLCARMSPTQLGQARQHEVTGSIGVMHVTRASQHIEERGNVGTWELAGLCDRAE